MTSMTIALQNTVILTLNVNKCPLAMDQAPSREPVVENARRNLNISGRAA